MPLDDLRRFAQRDWLAGADSKRDHWAEQFERHGSEPARRAAAALWLHMRTVQTDYPSPAERAADFEHHVTLRSRLDRAHAFTDR